jgi:hypothetical protein
MKRTTRIMLLLVIAAGIGGAGVVNFASLSGPINITTPNLTTIDQVTFQYDPQGDPAAPPTRCPFDAGQGGFQWSPGACVGAQVDSAGVYGTTEGAYALAFAVGGYELQFSFGIFTNLALPQVHGVDALFFRDALLTDVFALAGELGLFSYTGPVFNRVELYFWPAEEPLDPTTGLPLYGMTAVQMSDMSYTAIPEPGAIVLLGSALLGLAAWKRLKRNRGYTQRHK